MHKRPTQDVLGVRWSFQEPGCDYVQGPKGARRSKGEGEDAVYDFKDRINFSVFPSLQGGPHNHQARTCSRV